MQSKDAVQAGEPMAADGIGNAALLCVAELIHPPRSALLAERGNLFTGLVW